MNKIEGFDLDEETIETFDAILLALTHDPELAEEFTKLKFIQVLKDEYDGSTGPIKQIMQKLAQIEQGYNHMVTEHAKAQMDAKRAVADMIEATRKMRQVAITEDRQERLKIIEQLEGIERRQGSYTWNQK